MPQFVPLIMLAALVLALPLCGVWLGGLPLERYLAFPPAERYVRQAAFSWPVFTAYALFIGLVVAAVARRAARGAKRARPAAGGWPRRGTAGALLLGAAWVLAWTRFEFFRTFQLHTFFPLWLGYILFLDALCAQRTGSSPLGRGGIRYAALFAASAVFWWSFEYLNRFVQNWSYLNVEQFSPLQYFLLAALSFSTVLPAVQVTAELAASVPALDAPFADWRRVRLPASRAANLLVLCACCAVLLLIGIVPDLLFSMLWVLPPVLLHVLQRLCGQPAVLDELAAGDWRGIIRWAAAAVVCGFFWELWNYGSCAKWVYHIPYVQRFSIFEMPLLGYAGYLPFGVFCKAVVDLLTRPALSRGKA